MLQFSPELLRYLLSPNGWGRWGSVTWFVVSSQGSFDVVWYIPFLDYVQHLGKSPQNLLHFISFHFISSEGEDSASE